MSLRRLRAIVFSALCIAAPRAALACPVCFGNSDAPMAIATNTGIMAMLVVVVGVLGAFASFFIYLVRRQRLVNAGAAGAAEGPRYTSDSRSVSEGTAQC